MNPPWELIEAHLDGELNAADEARLCDWLSADSQHVQVFVREVHLHQRLRAEMQVRSRQAQATVPWRSVYGLDRIAAALKRVLEASARSWRMPVAFATTILLLLSLAIWHFGPTMGEPVLADVKGVDVSIERGTEFVPAANGMGLRPAEVLRLGTNATATIAFGPEQTRFELSAGATLELTSLAYGKDFLLTSGKIKASVARQRPFHPMILATPQAEARVLGTKFSLLTTAEITRLEVTQGKVRFTRLSDNKSVQVAAGNYAVAAADCELAALPLSGRILREYWTNLPGEYFVTFLTAHPDFPDHPSGHDYLDKFEAPSHWGENYGARIRGYLHPPKTGEYTFWIAAGDGGELWLSPDDDPGHKIPIGNSEPAAPHEWGKLRKQQSPVIPLVAGRKYYIEALQKQGVKHEDHLAVAWQGPSRVREVVPGKFLSPFKPKTKEKKR
jgi:hypothetical protein